MTTAPIQVWPSLLSQKVGFRTWSGAGLRLHAHDWSSDWFLLNQSFAGSGVSVLFETGVEGSE